MVEEERALNKVANKRDLIMARVDDKLRFTLFFFLLFYYYEICIVNVHAACKHAM